MNKLVLGVALAAGLTVVPAHARHQWCWLSSSHALKVDSPCTMTPRSQGGFTMTALPGRFLTGDVSILVVKVTGADTGELLAIYRNVKRSSWGPLYPSRTRRECWAGESFVVCAYRRRNQISLRP